ncbi:MAG: MFS transporter [Candidatus Caldarchaeum sp.]
MKELSLGRTVVKNIALLTSCQALNTVVVQFFVVFAPAAILLLGGSAALAGLGSAFIWGGRLISTYQLGALMDRLGRRPVIAGGMALAAAASLVAALSVSSRALPLFLLTLLLYGVGRGMVEFSRVAVADMLPANRRGLGTGIILTGSIAGTLATPLLVSYITQQPNSTQSSNVVTSLYNAAFISLLGLMLSLLVWPDPLKMAGQSNNPIRGRRDVLRRLREPGILTAAASMAASTGVMVAVMSLNTVLMYSHQHSATDISTVVMIHVIGMYAFSIPLGRLSDKVGRPAVMLAGMVVTLAGVLLLPLSSDMTVVTVALFLVGLGWSAAWVASSAYIADLTVVEERGGVTGVADAVAAGSSIIMPILGGLALEAGGAGLLAATAVAASLPSIAACIRVLRFKP